MSASDNPFSEYSDLSNCGLRLGVEIEFPANDGSEPLTAPGESTNDFCDEARHGSNRWRDHSDFGVMHYDGTVGAEIVNPDPLQPVDAVNFYDETLELAEAEYGKVFEPTGMMKGGSTAGLHIHLSPLSEDKAKRLAKMSKKPWMQVFACTSVAQTGSPEMPVFRGENYCNLVDSLRGSRYNAVNHRSGDHYEWRLPEPMTPQHFRHLMKFLNIFEDDPDAAEDFAKWCLRRREDEITSILRAKTIGVPTDFDSLPLVSRSRHPETERFYNDVNRASGLPYIYRVTYEGQDFYAFDTANDEYEDREWRVGGFGYEPVEFTVDTVFYADDLSIIEDEEVVDPVRDAVSNRAEYQSHGDRNETEATKTLKDVLDKDF